MNARRLISHPSDKGRTLAHRQPRIVRRITCVGTMSELGQSRKARLKNLTSALAPIADLKETDVLGGPLVPTLMCRNKKNDCLMAIAPVCDLALLSVR